MEGGLEDILKSVLSDPGKMQQIMGLAQSLGVGPPSSSDSTREQSAAPSLPDPPVQLMGLLKGAEIDSDQQALLTALMPYMSQGRVQKLRRAMQAAKMAELAETLLKQNRAMGG